MGKFYIDVDPESRQVRNWYPGLDATPSAPTIVEISAADFEKWHTQSVTFSTAGEFSEYIPPKTLSGQQGALATLTTQKKALGVYFQPSGTSAAVLFPSDDTSYANALQQAQVAQLGAWADGTAWTLADGSSVPMSSDDVTALFKKMAKYRGACQNRAAALSKPLESDLNADLTAGWPDNH